MLRTITTALALATLLPVAATAQGHHHGQHGAHEARQGPAMGGQGGGMGMLIGRPGPGMILRLESVLELSPDQVERMTELHETVHATMQEHRSAARDARARATEALAGDRPDMAAFEAALQEAAAHDVEAQVAMARAHMEAGEMLEPDQQERLMAVFQGMHELRGGGHHGAGAMSCPGCRARGGAGHRGGR